LIHTDTVNSLEQNGKLNEEEVTTNTVFIHSKSVKSDYYTNNRPFFLILTTEPN